MAPARKAPKQLQLDGLPTIHPNAAGMDIGAELIVVAVPADRDGEPVRAFRTFTLDLHELVAWLVSCGIDTVAMEATGVYWVPIYELLEAQGMVPYLVNARHMRMVPGRKTDWNDAQRLQKLHALGLLQASFRPDAEIVALRTLVRYRAEVVQHRSPHVNQMQQALKLRKGPQQAIVATAHKIARIALARQHQRVANQRKDHLHKLSAALVREHDAVVLEDLNVSGLGKSNLAKSVHDAHGHCCASSSATRPAGSASTWPLSVASSPRLGSVGYVVRSTVT